MYLTDSDIVLRINLNPFKWKLIPVISHDPPTSVFPKRHTFVIVWLFLQLFLDIDDGTVNTAAINMSYFDPTDIEVSEEDDDELEFKIPRSGKKYRGMVKGS